MKVVRFPLKPGVKYYTRGGEAVRIYATDAGGAYPVHGAYKKGDDRWEQMKWSEKGTACTYTGLKEMNITHEEWIPQDKELVWCWNGSYEFFRYVKFYDAKNASTFDGETGERYSSKWDNYAPFEGEWPQWAKDAYKRLKD
jgi:hypothetical protein